ncbi:MAG TPA: phosphotransferase [Micromonosporaceae bacterium]|nr:phosphotransferase [Micromonosporaceae bacterium]
MLPLSEIAGLAATLDRHGRSEVADAVAAVWGRPAGEARFRRSSASHVFLVAHPLAPTGRAYLRFVPGWWRGPGRIAAVAELMCRYGRLGRAVAQPVPSVRGSLVEAVATPRGEAVAMLVAEAPGGQVELADLSVRQARAWGAGLAGLHSAGAGDAGRQLPELFGDLDRAEQVLAGDPPLAGQVARLRAHLSRLPRDHGSFGVVHGDFELDNLVWHGEAATAYDFDDAGHGWFVADIAHALRDLRPALTWVDTPVTATFLAGYRSVRTLAGRDLTWLAVLAAAHAAVWLVRLPGIVDLGPARTDPPWLSTLRAKLYRHGDRQRDLVLAAPLDA